MEGVSTEAAPSWLSASLLKDNPTKWYRIPLGIIYGHTEKNYI
jgi:hypothetical protein